ncbi:hypothetical protein ABW20_dc0103262 [Dactylellina cionopaga]|nr:hypothetical protein ABW20_dc0103262 [Dactylellina cionopaga]
MSQSQALPRRILFLKTLDEPLSSIGPSNKLLLETLHRQPVKVEERSWYHQHPETSGPITLEYLKTFHAITFIACYDYNLHITEFEKFLRELIFPAADAGVRVVNVPEILRWNSNKVYLRDLEKDLGIAIPETIFVDTSEGDVPLYQDIISRHQGTAAATLKVVIKPSVSASAKETYKIPEPTSQVYDPAEAQGKWENVYKYTRSLSPSAKVMIQAFEPAISRGEYSIIFLGGKYSHTMLKRPAEGHFVAIEEFGAVIRVLEDKEVPEEGKEVGRKVLEYVKERFGSGNEWKLGYLRLDGVVRDGGEFVVIEAEMFEPYVYFDAMGAQEGLQRFCEVLVGH